MDEPKGYYPLPQPEEISLREREDAMGAYLMMFAALAAGLPLPIINLLAAIIYFYLNRSKSKFVHFHSLHSLLAQIPTTLLNAGLVFWVIRIYLLKSTESTDVFVGYFWMVVFANLLYFIFSIIAAVRARKGRFYYFLFFGRYAYQKVYTIKETSTKEVTNKPPGI